MKHDREPLLQVNDLRVSFLTDAGPARAVDGVSFNVEHGATVALVGESGCGKSATALALSRLLPSPPAWIEGGSICFMGQDVLQMSARELRSLRGGRIAYVFQEPGAALNPVMRIGAQMEEALRLHKIKAHAYQTEVLRLLELVEMPAPGQVCRAYPHQLSGGMQQRAVLAMALACRPLLLVADEPTTALDVTVQAKIMRLLVTLQKESGLALLLITHNFGLAAQVADYILVMYAGRIVEQGPIMEVLQRPLHPYTRGLLAAVPSLDAPAQELRGIPGQVPLPTTRMEGCRFCSRCSLSHQRCRGQEPEMVMDHNTRRGVRCWHVDSAKPDERPAPAPWKQGCDPDWKA